MSDLKKETKLNKFFAGTAKNLKNAYSAIAAHPLLETILIAHLLTVIIEILSRRSVLKCFSYILTHPLFFEYNVIIILSTLALAFLFKKRDFILLIVSVIWLGLGIVNFVLLSFRTTPLLVVDFQLLTSIWTIIGVYLNVWQIILIVAASAAVIAGAVYAGLKMPKKKVHYIKACSFVGSMVIAVIGASFLSLNTVSAENNTFANLPRAYSNYGFVYCFSTSLVDQGINKPNDYSEDSIDEIMNQISAEDSNNASATPNIVFIQLESFFDANYMKDVTYSENPIPVFTHLKENYPSAFITVPSIGGGTANTEFEVLTGMNLDYFGIGEYPYKTVLLEKTCESICYNLRTLGYSSHAIHNHSGSFYDRNQVYSNIGFDNFASIEYMDNVERNPLDWAEDNIVSQQVLKSLKSTEGKDFVWGITVQTHGKYPTEVIDPTQKITLNGVNESRINKISFEYYINQLHKCDAFIGNLIAMLSDYDEPVVLVMYGDHLPSFNLEETDLSKGNLYQTEYVIWNNYGAEFKAKDLSSYQLSAYINDQLGINTGAITKLHQKYLNNQNYQHALESIQYDMLYGDGYSYNFQNRFEPTELHMGIDDISISNAYLLGENIYVTGKNFTPYSNVIMNGKRKDTEFIDENTLTIEKSEISEGDTFAVSQIGQDKKVLSTTNDFIYGN